LKPRKLQVWQTALIFGGKQRCVMVAAPSRKEAARLMRASYAWLGTHGYNLTHLVPTNADVATAFNNPGILYASADMNYPRVYKEIPSFI
jgi:hypothetical protein